MAYQATFTADFTAWNKALADAKLGLESFEVSSEGVSNALTRMSKSFLGVEVQKQANLAVAAVEEIGGVTKLTETEQKKLNVLLTEAIAKYAALGEQAPAAMVAMAAETHEVESALTTVKEEVLALGKAFLAGFALAEIITTGHELLEMGRQIEDLGKKTHFSTEAVQSLGFAAKQSGLSFDDVAGAAIKLQKAIGGGGSGVVAALRDIGLTLEQVRALKPEDGFRLVAERLGQVDDASRQVADGTKLMGKGFSSIIPLINSDLAGLEQQAHDLGVVLDEQAVEALAEMGKAMERLQLKGRAAMAEALVPLTPLLTLIADAVVGASRKLTLMQLGFEQLLVWTEKAAAGFAIFQVKAMQLEQLANPALHFSETFQTAMKQARADIKLFADAADDLQKDVDRRAGAIFMQDLIDAGRAGAEAGHKIHEGGDEASKSLDVLSASLRAARAELASLKPDQMKELVSLIKSGAFSIQDLAAASGLSESALKLLEKQLSDTARATKEAGDAADTYRERASAMRADILKVQAAIQKANDKLTDRSVGKWFDELNKNLAEAKKLTAAADYEQATRSADAYFGALKNGGLSLEGLKKVYDDIEKATDDLYRAGKPIPPEWVEIGATVGGQLSRMQGELKNTTSRATELALMTAVPGKMFGAVLKDGAKAVSVFDNLGESIANAVIAAASGGGNVGQAVGSTIGKSVGDAAGKAVAKGLGGKLGGLIGGALGPVGSLVGGFLGGGISKLFGKLFGSDRKEGNKLKDQFIDAAGGLSALNEQAHDAGVTLDHLFAAKGTKQVQKAIDELNAALQKRQEEIKKYIAEFEDFGKRGVLITKDMATELSKLKPGTDEARAAMDLMVASTQGALDGLEDFAKNGKVASEGAADAIGASLVQVFKDLQAQGATLPEALAAIGPTIQDLEKQFAAAGFTGGAAFQDLAADSALASDTIAGPLLQSVGDLNKVLVGLGNQGQLTQDEFVGLGDQVAATFDSLTKQGFDGNRVLREMQPTLQTLWQLEQDFGFKADEATQKLIDQAVASGEVGDQFRSDQDKMTQATLELVDVMKALVQTLGGDVPEAAQQGADAVAGAFGNLNIPPVEVPYEYIPVGDGIPGAPPDKGSGVPGSSGAPSFSGGSDGLVNFGRETWARLHGREAVLTEDQYRALVGSGRPISGAGGVASAAPVVVTQHFNDTVFLDSHASVQRLAARMSTAFMDEMRRRGYRVMA